MSDPTLAYPPEMSLALGAAVLVGGTVVFALVLLVTRWLARRG